MTQYELESGKGAGPWQMTWPNAFITEIRPHGVLEKLSMQMSTRAREGAEESHRAGPREGAGETPRKHSAW